MSPIDFVDLDDMVAQLSSDAGSHWSNPVQRFSTECTESDGQIPHKPGVCTRLLGLAIGAVLVLNGTLHAGLYKKFTPLYTATECGDQVATLDEFELGLDTIHVGFFIEVTCKNPNPYDISIVASTPGEVYIGKDALEVGKLTIVPGSHLEQQGGGKVRVRMSSDIEGPSAAALLPHFLKDVAIPITMRVQFSLGISVPVCPMFAFHMEAPIQKHCGMNVKGLLVSNSANRSRLGPVVCRESFEGLEIPDVDEKGATSVNGQMTFTSAQVAPVELGMLELLKNVILGLVVALSYLFAILVPIRFWTVGPACPKRLTQRLVRYEGSVGQRRSSRDVKFRLEDESEPLRQGEGSGVAGNNTRRRQSREVNFLLEVDRERFSQCEARHPDQRNAHLLSADLEAGAEESLELGIFGKWPSLRVFRRPSLSPIAAAEPGGDESQELGIFGKMSSLRNFVRRSSLSSAAAAAATLTQC